MVKTKRFYRDDSGFEFDLSDFEWVGVSIIIGNRNMKLGYENYSLLTDRMRKNIELRDFYIRDNLELCTLIVLSDPHTIVLFTPCLEEKINIYAVKSDGTLECLCSVSEEWFIAFHGFVMDL